MCEKWLAEDAAEVAKTVRSLYPDPNEITLIEHGHDNLVVCVDRDVVFRFPRSLMAAKRLNFEAELLGRLKGKISSVPISDAVSNSQDPAFSVMRFCDGEHFEGHQIESLLVDDQIAIGRQMAEFIAEFSRAMPADELRNLRKQTGVEGIRETWSQYFHRIFLLQPLPDNRLQPVISKYYLLWNEYADAEEAIYSIHDDLHLANVLFSGPKVSAVLDFCDATVGSVEEEMRNLYRMGDVVLRSAIERHAELTGRVVNYEHVRVWVIMNELVRFVRYLGEGKADYHIAKIAHANLRKWIPNFPL